MPRVWVALSYSATQLSQDPALQGVQLWLLGYLTLCGPELPPFPPIISTYALWEEGASKPTGSLQEGTPQHWGLSSTVKETGSGHGAENLGGGRSLVQEEYLVSFFPQDGQAVF